MLTGTPLDLTPFGDLLKAIGGLYWLLMLAPGGAGPVAAQALVGQAAPWRRPSRRCSSCQCSGMWTQRAVEANAGKARLDAALAHFEMRCKGAGEKIHRTVENVEGVAWMKWRDKADPRD